MHTVQSWNFWVILLSVSAALTAVFAKFGIQDVASESCVSGSYPHHNFCFLRLRVVCRQVEQSARAVSENLDFSDVPRYRCFPDLLFSRPGNRRCIEGRAHRLVQPDAGCGGVSRRGSIHPGRERNRAGSEWRDTLAAQPIIEFRS